MDGAAELGAEHVVDEAVLGEAAQAGEGRETTVGPEVVAAAGEVLDLGDGAGNGRLDALLQVLGGWHIDQG